MGKHADRRQAQEADQRAWEASANARPNEPPTQIPEADKCPVGGAHDFTMKGSDGIRRCWYCARRKPTET